MWRRIPLMGIVVLLWWISFAPDPVQLRYRIIANFALTVLLLLSIIAQKSNLRKLLFEKQDILLWIYLLIVVIGGVFFAQERLEALKWFYRVILPVPLIYLLFKNEINRTSGLVIAKSLCLFCSIVVLIGLIEFIFHRNWIYEHLVYNQYYYRFLYLKPRMMSTLFHPAALGSYLLACLPFSFVLISIKGRLVKYLGLCAALFMLGIIFTFSRGTLLGAFVLSWIYFWRKTPKKFIKSFIIIALSIFILSSLLSGWSSFSRFSFKGLAHQPTYQYKMDRVFLTRKILKDHPFFGVGLNHYRLLFDKYYGSSAIPLEWRVPDNMYLAILAETGILGFLAFIAFIAFLLRRAFLYYHLTKDKISKELIIATASGIIGLMVNFITYDTLYWAVPLFLFWILIGMASGIIGMQERALR